nr:phage BR0599 family protein [Rhodophyticola porphyridii]
MIRLEAGCDKRMETCRLKFNNLLNFRGFPDIPGDDWLMSYPARTNARDGGSRR